MRLSQTAEYALRAALHIAQHGRGAAIPVGDIAEQLSVPKNYLSKILHQLAKAGVLISRRGPGGGFELSADAHHLSLAEIVEPVDPMSEERRCLLGRPECSNDDPCIAHEEWRKIADRMHSFFQETTLASLSSQGGAL